MNGLYDEIKVALHNVWKRRWLALLVAWGVCLLGWLIVAMMPNRYESQARVFVSMQSMLPDAVGVKQNERQRGVERVKRTLTSTVNLEKVVRGTELASRTSSNRQVTETANGLRESIKVIEQQENLFQITATTGFPGMSDSENAKLSRNIVQKMIDIFVEENLNGGRTEATQTLRFLDQQIAQKQVQLTEAENKRVQFETKYIGRLPGVGSNATRRESARMELNQVESNLVAAQSALSAINSQLASTAPTIVGPPSYIPGGPGGGVSRVAQLEAQMSEGMARGWTDSHPDMIALRGQLERARRVATPDTGPRMQQGISSPNPVYTTLRMQLADRQAAVSALSARRGQLAAEVAQLGSGQFEEPGLAAEQQRLSKDYDVVKVQFDKLLADRENVRMQTTMQSSTDAVTFRVIDPPSQPRAPIAPDRNLMMTAVLVLGLLAGIGAAFAMSQVQTGFVTAQRLAKASGLQVIGSISEVLSPQARASAAKKLRMFFVATAGLAGVYALLLVVEMLRRGGMA
jgi:polysaccharide chain length determinant protein (PEP-CTERM system associated)